MSPKFTRPITLARSRLYLRKQKCERLQIQLFTLSFALFWQITVTDQGVPARSTTVRVIVRVLDENDNRPIFMEKVYKIKLPEREKVEKERSVRREPVYRVIASDRDHGANAEISYSIEDGDEQGKFFIEPKTGLVSSKKFSTAGEYDILTVRPCFFI